MSRETRRQRARRLLGAALTAVLLGVAGAIGVAAPAHAATFEVTVTTGNGAGSLPEAVALANANPDLDVITFDLPDPSTIVVDSADLLVITESITITGTIDVEITGLTVTSITGGVCGIDAYDATLVLDDIVANDFDCAGISVEDGGLTATNIVALNNDFGIIFSSTADPSLPLVIDGADLTGSFSGVVAYGTNSTMAISNVVADDTEVGVFVYLSGPDGRLTMTDVRTDRASSSGLNLILDDEAQASITRSSASDATGQGMYMSVGEGAQLTIDDATAARNELGGISLDAGPGAVIEVLNSTVDGNGAGCGCGGSGIVVRSYDAEVTIANTEVTNNEGQVGGGINVDTFIGEDAKLVIRDSLIADNHAGFGGGGFSVDDLGLGEAAGTISILRTTISGNTSPDGGGVLIGNFSFSAAGPLVTIDQSTISGNNSEAEPGLYGGGMSIYKDDDHDPGLGVIDIINSTISGNFAEVGSGIYSYADGATTDSMSTRIRHSTIAANVGDGGVILEGIEQQLVLDHALIANNGTTDLDFIDAPELFTMAFSLVEEPGAGVTIPGGFSNQTGVDPRLGPLANNGGPTFTHNLLEGSPAFNKGNPAFVAPPSVDQRGLARVVQIIDIGAVERTVLLPPTGATMGVVAPVVALFLLLAGLTLLGLRRLHV